MKFLFTVYIQGVVLCNGLIVVDATVI